MVHPFIKSGFIYFADTEISIIEPVIDSNRFFTSSMRRKLSNFKEIEKFKSSNSGLYLTNLIHSIGGNVH